MGFSDLEGVMRNLVDTGKYADMTVICEEQIFEVHRAIICSQSPYFDAALNHGFKETTSSRISLPEDDAHTISSLLSFCYVQSYDRKIGTDLENVHHDLSMFLAADKYDIPRLQDLAMSRLVDWLDTNWASKEFPGIIQEIWSCVPRHANKLRDNLIELVATHIQHFISQADAHDILIRSPELAVAVLKLVIKNKSRPSDETNVMDEQKKRLVLRKFGRLT